MTMTDEVCTYADLQRQMHDALRAQHPEWIQPDGDSPICDDYESRFAELLNLFSERTDHWKSQRSKRLARHIGSAGLLVNGGYSA